MKSLDPYLIFSGTCREAMTFYADCLEGNIETMQTFGESPVDVGADETDRIFNSVMVAGDIRIRASDDLANYSVQSGTNFSLYVHCDSEEEVHKVFMRLSEGGKTLFPLENRFGMLEDRFSVRWMLTY